MGLFGKLFEKKECAVCGGEIGLLGNRKLEDGNLCKACAAKLSPWFSDRRSSTVAQIQEQLAYREENKQAVANFRVTRTLGQNIKVLLDEDAGKFMVTSARNIQEANPDVLDFSQITDCNVDVQEEWDGIKREGPDGKEVSYNPPRYRYDYDFFVIIHVNAPYFDEIRFRLNNCSVEAESTGGFGRTNFDPRTNVDYREYEAMGQEIKEALTQARRQVREEAAAAAAPKTSVACPWCGATTTPDPSGCCEYCGGALNG